MCTLVIAWQALDDAPVVVAANRDEAVDRPSTPPHRWAGEPGIVAPRDERAGGTWIGYNDEGVFAGISNRWTDRELTASRSRGRLVLDALGRRTAESAVSAIQDALETDDYDGFNLVVADAEVAILLGWDGRLHVTAFEPGLHVVMNAGYDDRFHVVEDWPEAARRQAESARSVREALAPRDGESSSRWLDRAATVLGDHDYGVCVHGDVSERRSDGQPDADASGTGFGTRSSSLLAIHDDGAATYRYADGPPCTTEFRAVEGQS